MLDQYCCKRCNNTYKSRMSLVNHIIRTHKYTCKQYYDEFYKSESDGYCENCGKETKFLDIENGYAKCCCIKCAMPGRAKRNIEKTGYSSNFVNPEIKKLSHSKEANLKRKSTMLDRYGVDSYTKTDDFKEKSKQYNKEHNDEIVAKRKQSMIEKYGVDCNFSRQEVISKNKINSHTKEANEKRKQTCLKNHGVDCIFKDSNVQEKAQKNSHTKEALDKRTNSRKDHVNEISYKGEQTKRRKGNYSKLEKYFEDLCDILSITCIDNYYIDERYPYLCDFYLPEYDYFIEIFGGWFHNDHLFGTEDNDNDILDFWKEKAKYSKSYKYAIDIWTHKDIEKINCAKKNKLNFAILWSKDDIDKFLNNLK